MSELTPFFAVNFYEAPSKKKRSPSTNPCHIHELTHVCVYFYEAPPKKRSEVPSVILNVELLGCTQEVNGISNEDDYDSYVGGSGE